MFFISKKFTARYLQKLKSPSEAFWGGLIAVSLSKNVPHMSLAFQPFFHDTCFYVFCL